MRLLVVCLIACLLTAACGYKGALYLPATKPAPEGTKP
ncbi:lipoprotein [Chitinimonas sp.]